MQKNVVKVYGTIIESFLGKLFFQNETLRNKRKIVQCSENVLLWQNFIQQTYWNTTSYSRLYGWSVFADSKLFSFLLQSID